MKSCMLQSPAPKQEHSSLIIRMATVARQSAGQRATSAEIVIRLLQNALMKIRALANSSAGGVFPGFREDAHASGNCDSVCDNCDSDCDRRESRSSRSPHCVSVGEHADS